MLLDALRFQQAQSLDSERRPLETEFQVRVRSMKQNDEYEEIGGGFRESTSEN